MAEAIELMNERRDVIVCCPLYGPPAPDGRMTGHVSHWMQPEPHTSVAYRANFISTRLFMLDQERFQSEIGCLPLIRPGRRRVLHRWANSALGILARSVLAHKGEGRWQPAVRIRRSVLLACDG